MLIERLSNHAAVKHQDVAAERVKRTCSVPCKQRMVTTHHAVTMPCTQRMQTCVKPSHAHDKYDRDEHATMADARTVFSTPFSSVAALIATPIDFIPGVTGVAAAAPSITVAIVASVIIITPLAIACSGTSV
jgi:hypothetical protein